MSKLRYHDSRDRVRVEGDERVEGAESCLQQINCNRRGN